MALPKKVDEMNVKGTCDARGPTLAFLARIVTRSLAHQPKADFVGRSSMSIALHAATQVRRPLASTAVRLPSSNESHPMDHDSDSSGHANRSLTPLEQRTFLLKFARGRRRYRRWIFEAKKRFGLSVLNYIW